MQELYATSSKFDKLKISKAIVAAVREFGGHFCQADEKRGGLYFDIGDKRAWDKTSQALREGQADIRAKLAAEDPAGMSKINEYKQVISEQTFFAYSCRVMESLFHPEGDGMSACGRECPHAKRRQTLNTLGANPMQIHNAMQSLSPPPLPPAQQGQVQTYLMGAADVMQNNNFQQQQYNNNMQPYQADLNSFEPLPYNEPMPPLPPVGGQFEPLPYASGGAPNNYNGPNSNSITSQDVSGLLGESGSLQKPGLMYDRGSSQGTAFSLRNLINGGFEVNSEEGKQLMDQLNLEVDQLIRRKSYGLIQIDTKEAFEDLVFEEDSMMQFDDDDLKDIGPLKNEKEDTDKMTANKMKQGRMASSLTYKDDMSLMNMSILSLDDRGESTALAGEQAIGGLFSGGPKDGNDTPKSILSDPSGPRDMRKRRTRVSFAGKNDARAMSLMSMDDKSFSKLVDCISDPESSGNEGGRNMSELSTDSALLDSRKMGFPVRKEVAQKLEGGGRDISALAAQKGDRPQDNEQEFSHMAGKVSNPGSEVTNSLSIPGGPPNISQLNMSTMSLASDIDPELLK